MTATAQLLDRLDVTVEQLTGLPADELADRDVTVTVTRLERAARRLQAHASTLAGELAARRARQAAAERPNQPRAPERAARDVQNELSHQLNESAADTRRRLKTARAAEFLGPARQAWRDGDITDTHVQLLDRALAHLTDRDARHEAEVELLESATTQDPVTFGRTVRAWQAEHAPDEADRLLDRQYSQRKAYVKQTPEGTTRLFAEGPGLDAEILWTAIDAFRRPDAADEHRHPEQRTWDALIDVCQAALRAGEAPAKHGVKPQVAVQIPQPVLEAAQGAGQATYTGPQPLSELRRLMGDATVTAILTNPRWIPLEVSGHTRYIPVALWQALRARDRTCIWQGCDQPAQWCDIAHLDIPYGDNGGLTLQTAGLLCRRHHRLYDRNRHRYTYRLDDDGRPVICHTDGTDLTTPGGTDPPGDPPESDLTDGDAQPGLFASEDPATYTAA